MDPNEIIDLFTNRRFVVNFIIFCFCFVFCLLLLGVGFSNTNNIYIYLNSKSILLFVPSNSLECVIVQPEPSKIYKVDNQNI